MIRYVGPQYSVYFRYTTVVAPYPGLGGHSFERLASGRDHVYAISSAGQPYFYNV